MNQTNKSFDVNPIDLYKNPITNNTVCNEQPSQELAPQLIPALPYSKQKLKFLNSFHFQYSDLNDSGYIQLCKNLVERKQ